MHISLSVHPEDTGYRVNTTYVHDDKMKMSITIGGGFDPVFITFHGTFAQIENLGIVFLKGARDKRSQTTECLIKALKSACNNPEASGPDCHDDARPEIVTNEPQTRKKETSCR